MGIKTLVDFYDLMFKTRDVRKEAVVRLFNNNNLKKHTVPDLKDALSILESIKKDSQGQYSLSLNEEKTISLDISYEISELKKDIFFLENSEDQFYAYLDKSNPGFLKEVEETESKLKDISFRNFITDRDGTINNYCGRYGSSIQSIYNALFLSRFGSNSVENAIILTSAPLDNIGLADVSTALDKVFIYAGSKGREYFDKEGRRQRYPIETEKQAKLDSFNKRSKQLLDKPNYRIFSLIGSGLQLKFGQTTIARQDISRSIPERESNDFLALISNIVSELDPKSEFFRIEDTGTDIEVILTVASKDANQELKDFDKADAVNFLNTSIGLNLKRGPNLICGDTNSDIPMVSASKKECEDTWAIFVGSNAELRDKVKQSSSQSLFVSKPDVLVAVLNNLGKR